MSSCRRRTQPLSAHIDTSIVAAGYLEKAASSSIGYMVENLLTQMHAGHMDADDFAGVRLSVNFQRDRHSGNGASLIVTVGEE